VDYGRLREQIEFEFRQGRLAVPRETASRRRCLTRARAVISEVVQTAAGRVKVRRVPGSNSTSEALRLTKWAAKERADAALMVDLTITSPLRRILQHYRTVAKRRNLDLRLQHPGSDGQEHRARDDRAFGLRFEHHEVKEATGSLDQGIPRFSAHAVTVLSGDDSPLCR